jgi:hypothetical protein
MHEQSDDGSKIKEEAACLADDVSAESESWVKEIRRASTRRTRTRQALIRQNLAKHPCRFVY